MNYISFLVDALPEHYFKAELLLHSLNKVANCPKEHILVQCVNRVDNTFLAFLQRNEYKYHVIDPFLDGKYCNKIPQLDVFIGSSADGIFLLDVDMFVLSPLSVPDTKCVWGKVVDGPNPPLPVLKRIFEEANLSLPDLADTDWSTEGADTLDCYFNGGFYYIPGRYSELISEKWKDWATWLFGKRELFPNDKLFNHVDQISMSLSLIDSGTPYRKLTSNYNCPTHVSQPLRSFTPGREIFVLHYHNQITPFGTLSAENSANKEIKAAIETANRSLASQGDFRYFHDYKISQLSPHVTTRSFPVLDKYFSELANRTLTPIKFILHAGTPKTGTTSLQVFFDQHRDELKKSGYLYPECPSNQSAPKHQWLTSGLHGGNAAQLFSELSKVIDQLEDGSHTVILSTEGLYNHWWDFPPEAKSFLSIFSKYFDVEVWAWFRKPIAFMHSLYRQNMVNPRVPSVKCYGRDLSFEETLNDTWFIRHLDYLGFICECELIFGNGSVVAFPYNGNVLATACGKLGLDIETTSLPRANPSNDRASVELLRVINRYSVDAKERQQILPLIKRIGQMLPDYDEAGSSDHNGEAFISVLSSLGIHTLMKDYHLDLT